MQVKGMMPKLICMQLKLEAQLIESSRLITFR